MRHTTSLSFVTAVACHALVLFGLKVSSDTPIPAERTYLEVSLAPSAPPVEEPSVETSMPPTAELLSARRPESSPPAPEPMPSSSSPAPIVEARPLDELKSLEPPVPSLPAKLADVTPPSEVSGDGSPVRATGETSIRNQSNVNSRYQTIDQPYYLRRGKPEYPNQAKRLKQEGIVVLALFINELGGLDKIEVLQSSGFPLLDEAAVRAERRSRFRPAYVGNRPIACRAEVPYRFVLPK